MQARTKLIDKLGDVFQRYKSQSLASVGDLINPILYGWVRNKGQREKGLRLETMEYKRASVGNDGVQKGSMLYTTYI